LDDRIVGFVMFALGDPVAIKRLESELYVKYGVAAVLA
jgi:hypothetical protein